MATLLRPSRVLLMTLRHGRSPAGRAIYEVSVGEVEALARDHGLGVLRVLEQPDLSGRFDVTWTQIALRLPDDGSMGLPLIRGLILNESKSATQQLGLLRAVAKIADAAPSLASTTTGDTDTIEIPWAQSP